MVKTPTYYLFTTMKCFKFILKFSVVNDNGTKTKPRACAHPHTPPLVFFHTKGSTVPPIPYHFEYLSTSNSFQPNHNKSIHPSINSIVSFLLLKNVSILSPDQPSPRSFTPHTIIWCHPNLKIPNPIFSGSNGTQSSNRRVIYDIK
jgi:hypothetical protein